MILPTKIVNPYESLLNISSTILEVLLIESAISVDELYNQISPKFKIKLSIELLLLSLNFLFILNLIEEKNAIIKIKRK